MTEKEFIASIECQFPYHDADKWRAIVELGASISPNSAFMVLHEICRVPAGTRVETEILKEILVHWCHHVTHPLVAVVLPAAEALIAGTDFSVDDSMRIMRSVGAYRDQFTALAIPYFACDDTEGIADELYQEITDSWRV